MSNLREKLNYGEGEWAARNIDNEFDFSPLMKFPNRWKKKHKNNYKRKMPRGPIQK